MALTLKESNELWKVWRESTTTYTHPVWKRWAETHGKFRSKVILLARISRVLWTVSFSCLLGGITYLVIAVILGANPPATAGGVSFGGGLAITVAAMCGYVFCDEIVSKFRRLLERSCDALGMHPREFCNASPEILHKYGRVRLLGMGANLATIRLMSPLSDKDTEATTEFRETYNLLVHHAGILPDTGYGPYFPKE